MCQLLRLLSLLTIFCIACSSNKPQNSFRHIDDTDDMYAEMREGKPWYRHYTGTVGGRSVSVNLYMVGDAVKGTYSYNNIGKVLDLVENPDSGTIGVQFLEESMPTELDSSYSHWEVTLSSDTLKGIWKSRDRTKSYPIDLYEDYSNNYELEPFIKDSTMVAEHKECTTYATSSYLLFIPPAYFDTENGDFIKTVICAKLHCDRATFEECVRAMNVAYFGHYKTEILGGRDIKDYEAGQYNFETSTTMDVLYNNNGFLIFEFLLSNNGLTSGTFACIDVPERKLWNLSDMLIPDTMAIASLLEEEARAVFKLPDGEPLVSRLNVERILPTNNVYLTDKGITFCYNPFEIAPLDDGHVQLFIPFTKLASLLTPEFKKRLSVSRRSRYS